MNKRPRAKITGIFVNEYERKVYSDKSTYNVYYEVVYPKTGTHKHWDTLHATDALHAFVMTKATLKYRGFDVDE